HRIDLRGQLVAGAPDLFGLHRVGDLVDHLGIAPEAFDAGDDDVRADGDQRGLERGALHCQVIRDLGVIANPLVDVVVVHARTTPASPEQSTSTASPSVGSRSSCADMMHGTWYSRLTMPMCDSGVPDKHTTAVSSSKIGARKVAPASTTHATMPSAVVSISASTSSGDAGFRHDPC